MMLTVPQVLSPHKLACKWVKVFEARPDMRMQRGPERPGDVRLGPTGAERRQGPCEIRMAGSAAEVLWHEAARVSKKHLQTQALKPRKLINYQKQERTYNTRSCFLFFVLYFRHECFSGKRYN